MARLSIDKIRTDGNTQPRIALDENTISSMASDLRKGRYLPMPIVVSFDGSSYWLVDGFHRVEALRRFGAREVTADIHMHEGPREAYIRALDLNAGMKLTAADRRAAAERLVKDPEWGQWSDREIARRSGVSYALIADLRPESPSTRNSQIPQRTEPERKTAVDEHKQAAPVIPLRPTSTPIMSEEPKPKKRKAVRNGKTYEIDTTNIGKGERRGKPKHLSVKAWNMLRDTEVAQDRNQRAQLERLPSKMQMQIARLIRENQATTVKEAVKAIAGGAAIDPWSKAYQAAHALPSDDRRRLANLLLRELDEDRNAATGG